jgi:hypothetical protein
MFLDVARQLTGGATEGHWRTAVGRSYYALMLEAREALRRWGFVTPRGEQAHRFVRLRFDFPADPDLRKIGLALENLGRRRNAADYELQPSQLFGSGAASNVAVSDAATAIALLDQIDAVPARRAAAVSAIHAAFP